VNGIKLFGSGQDVTFNNTVNASNATNGGKGNKYFGFTTGGSGNTVNIGGTFNSGDWYVMNNGNAESRSSGTLNTDAEFGSWRFQDNTGNQDLTQDRKVFQTDGRCWAGQVLAEQSTPSPVNSSGTLAVKSSSTRAIPKTLSWRNLPGVTNLSQ
jgi:hypothetical protein